MNRSKRFLSLPFATLSVLFLSVFSFGGVASAQSLTEVRPLSHNEQIIQQTSQAVQQKADTLEKTSDEAKALAEKKKALADQLEAEKARIAELKQQIADKKAAAEAAAKTQEAVAAPAQTVSYSAVNTAPVGNCGDNYYASYIYGMESGGKVVGNCSTTARNGSGCFGIGQACPGSKVESVCGADYACQNAWFTNYANKYGGWAGAYEFWLGHGWW